MFANFTEETATDSAGVLTLSGATTGMIPFSGSFADGDVVAYVAEDATNKVAGVGTYNSAGNTITRNDTWNYNGTVVDKNPSTNIALSGTVTVRCDVVDAMLRGISGITKERNANIYSSHINSQSGALSVTLVADQQYCVPFHLRSARVITSISVGVKTAVAGSTTYLGLSKLINGTPDTTYITSGTIDTTVTSNDRALAFAAKLLHPGWYGLHILSSHAIAVEKCGGAYIGWNPLDVLGGDRNAPGTYLYQTAVGGSLVANPSTLSQEQFNEDMPQFWMKE